MDAYDVLGVTAWATDDEIRDAYLRRSKELHPDRFAGATAQEQAAATRAMQELNAAYDTLRHRTSPAPPPPPSGPDPDFPRVPYPSRPQPAASRPPRRGRALLIGVAAMLVTTALVVTTGDARNAAPVPTTDEDLTVLEGECLTLDVTGKLEDVVDCTRPHDARVMKVVDHGTSCPVYTQMSMAGPRQNLCLDTSQ